MSPEKLLKICLHEVESGNSSNYFYEFVNAYTMLPTCTVTKGSTQASDL